MIAAEVTPLISETGFNTLGLGLFAACFMPAVLAGVQRLWEKRRDRG